jgi:hypothetical protein
MDEWDPARKVPKPVSGRPPVRITANSNTMRGNRFRRQQREPKAGGGLSDFMKGEIAWGVWRARLYSGLV